jgi:tRNA A58 N-methylase Trm61/beta-phosphoglucomutase-like phosphatase (HAD superfamily)
MKKIGNKNIVDQNEDKRKMKIEKKIYAMMFDFDGTLADTEKLHYLAFKKVLEKLKIELSWDDYMKKYLAYTDYDFFKVIAKEQEEKGEISLKEEDIKSLCEEKKKYFSEFLKREEVELYSGVKEFIEYVGSKYPICVVSGALKDEIIPVLEKNGILKFFKFIVSSEDYKEGKPSTEPFDVAIKKFEEIGVEISREGVIAFEDSIYGVISAKKSGFLVVAVKNFYPEDELKKNGADIVIDGFSNPQKIEEEIKTKISHRVFEGERVLLVSEGKDKTFMFKAQSNNSLHTHIGIIKGKDVVGKFYGEYVLSSKEKRFYILEPVLPDRIMKLKRKSAIIYPKDSAFMIFIAGIGPGSKVIETGCGSGGLTIALAHFVKPHGKVFTYEIRDDFIQILKENLEENNLTQYVEIKKRDVYKEGFDEKNVDAVFLDLPEPWHCIRFAWESLKPSGVLISISPTVNQTEIMCELMRRNGFILVDTYEVLVRRFLAREGKSRPYENMIAHTAYISVGRKVMM